MANYRRKRRPDGSSYTHPVGSGTSPLQEVIDRATKEATHIELDANGNPIRTINENAVRENPVAIMNALEAQAAEIDAQKIALAEKDKELAETTKVAETAIAELTSTPLTPSTALRTAPTATQAIVFPRVRVGTPASSREISSSFLPSTHLRGDVDVVESTIRNHRGVYDVKVHGLRKNRIEVFTNDGKVATYKKKKDRLGNINWNRTAFRSKVGASGKHVSFPIGQNPSLLAKEVQRVQDGGLQTKTDDGRIKVTGTPTTPIINISVTSGGTGDKTPASIVAPKEEVKGFPLHLEGSLDDVETALQARDDVATVKLGGVFKKHLDVRTTEGTKYRFSSNTDRTGGIHWRAKAPKPVEDEDSDDSEDSEDDDSGGSLWS
jgi:hypothetical protein